LTQEADKIVLTTISDSYFQGVCAMGAAYGSVVAARILLQPLEENARLLWSWLVSVGDNAALEQSYEMILRFFVYIGLVFGCVTVCYTNLLLNALVGRTWGWKCQGGQGSVRLLHLHSVSWCFEWHDRCIWCIYMQSVVQIKTVWIQ
jgi:hypothetical protein